MRAVAAFLIRLVGYAFVLGVTARVAESLWVARGLDGSLTLAAIHDQGFQVLLFAPALLALFGIGFLRPVAIFVAAALCGAALTAPFALARFAG